MSEQEPETQEFETKLKEILGKVLATGQLIVVGTKQTGKTNSVMWLLRKLIDSKDHEKQKMKTMVLDTVLNFRFKFDEIPYLDITKTRHIPLVQDLILDIPYADTMITRDAITEILMENFIKKRRIKKKYKGDFRYVDFYVVEEMQNVFGTYSLSGSNGRFALKIFSECANYGMVFLGITQRLADISAKIVERTRYFLVGNLCGDNDIGKLRRATNKQIAEKAKTLKRGEFLFIDREHLEQVSLIYFPKFTQNGEPYPVDISNNGKGYVKTVFLG